MPLKLQMKPHPTICIRQTSIHYMTMRRGQEAASQAAHLHLHLRLRPGIFRRHLGTIVRPSHQSARQSTTFASHNGRKTWATPKNLMSCDSKSLMGSNSTSCLPNTPSQPLRVLYPNAAAQVAEPHVAEPLTVPPPQKHRLPAKCNYSNICPALGLM